MPDSQFPSDPSANFVLDELRVAMTAAEAMADGLATQFAQGEPSPEQTEELVECLTVISSRAAQFPGKIPDEIRTRLSSLTQRLSQAVQSGETWLNQIAGPQLAEMHLAERLRRAYGLPP